MSHKRKPADSDIKIDCFRGLGAHSMTPASVLQKPDIMFGDMPRKGLLVIGKLAIANDFNRTIEREHHISPLNVSLARRCSAAFKIAARAYNHELKKQEPEAEFKVLVIKPAYALLQEAFTEMGWDVVETENFLHKKTDFQRLSSIRKMLRTDKKGEIRAISINSPNNPLCEVYSENFIRGMLQIMNEFPRISLFSDVVYEKLVNSPARIPTVFSLADEKQRGRIYEFSGNSKTVMPGDKRSAGWMLSSADNIRNVEKLLDKDKITNGKTHRLNKKRITTLITSFNNIPDDYYPNLFKYYAEVKKQVVDIITPQLPTGIKLINSPHLHFLLFDFSGLNNLGIDLKPKEVITEMEDEHAIRLLPSKRIGCADYLRISLGSAFVRKGENFPFKFKADKRDADFSDEYKDWKITSDVEVHKHVAGLICNVISKLLAEKLQSHEVSHHELETRALG